MNYKNHTRLNTFLFMPIFAGAALLCKLPGHFIVLGTGGFIFGTLLLSPDLDTYSRPYRNWGYLRFIWLPYRLLFTHRSGFTHGPLIGTALRLAYLYLVMLVLCLLFYLQYTDSSLLEASASSAKLALLESEVIALAHRFIGDNLPEIVAFSVGVELSSLAHILIDKGSSCFRWLR